MWPPGSDTASKNSHGHRHSATEARHVRRGRPGWSRDARFTFTHLRTPNPDVAVKCDFRPAAQIWFGGLLSVQVRSVRERGSGPLVADRSRPQLWLELAADGHRADPRYALRADAAAIARSFIATEWIDDDNQSVLVADTGDHGARVVVPVTCRPATVSLVLETPVTHTIGDPYVTPSERRTAAGTALVDAAVAWANGKGAERLEVGTLANDRRAVAFWSSQGFIDWRATLRRDLKVNLQTDDGHTSAGGDRSGFDRRCPTDSRPVTTGTLGIERVIGGDQRQRLELRLSDEHPVERIAVMGRERRRTLGVIGRNRQRNETCRMERSDQAVVHRQLAGWSITWRALKISNGSMTRGLSLVRCGH